MNPKPFSWPLFKQAPIVGICRGISFEEVDELLPVYKDAGLTTIEITMNTPDATRIIQHSLAAHGNGLNIGAGTVCTLADLDNALAAGAQFIVTPIISKKVIKACVARNVPIFPGAFTPTEIYKAWQLGASMVKIYPATSLGSSYIKDLKAPLNHLKVLPTGGISQDNIASFFKAGADGVGIGSHLLDTTLIRQKNWAQLKAHFQHFGQKSRPPFA
ncbi:bifunctional 4-hydroxy-2-oxoglutarate aldolase/2-dehydro-3-deoxy-phosphogluconate aldolase [Spirosoma sp. KUDC1026]|uniref:bifunctional 4-hydroxy-2-oxoglutarate aldolase/2-dehydro-3-deoxy-phosphogluconate aldolase n=1 Tax=Spirosoma sp. KUDC1026 TaxID=2745947 RepID=UPI00159BA748|nr:bifunctional 4-hydroxy-2-oxoglutarate aldolase/2-dehydro-3-deoxy-phosphogluconate aldolase [Spirosoma sp. KUDC1026]QKZ14025.1 bifunctional 4-hydroxy-2-oxoglutarate aldolase/2-dehydro-3-deoxy-phosphogluconate aldolase [Spirosoma sp. KUDC1026]